MLWQRVAPGQDKSWITFAKSLTWVRLPLRKVAQTIANERPWASFSEDLYAILIKKAEQESLTRVRAVKPGEGIKAYMSLHKWHSKTIGEAISERVNIL